MRCGSATTSWKDWGKRGKGEKAKRRKGKETMRQAKKLLFLWLLFVLSLYAPAARAQQSPAPSTQHPAPVVEAVEAVGMTVAEMDRSVDFYSTVLSFEKVSDVEVW